MTVAALWRLGNELSSLLGSPDGGFDLRLRHGEVRMWFAGWPVYTESARGDYPPASYALLWPLVGWLPFGAARWLWAATALAGLAWLAITFARASGASTRAERSLILLLPFSTYAASAALSVGQLSNHVLPLLIAGALALERGDGSVRKDATAAALLVPTLVKPTLSAPFFWVVCFVPGRIRPMVLVGSAYVLLTLFAAAFQPGDLTTTLLGWVAEKPQVLQGHANVSKLLALAGLRAWMLPVSAALLAALGVWVARHRGVDRWLLLGVTALVARLFVHHRLYDDLLLLVPMVTLFRIARQERAATGSDVAAGLLFAAMWATLHGPARLLDAGNVWSVVMEIGQSLVWLATLAFLLAYARGERQQPTGASAARP